MPAKNAMRPQDAAFGGKASLGRVGKEEFKDRARAPYACHVASTQLGPHTTGRDWNTQTNEYNESENRKIGNGGITGTVNMDKAIQSWVKG